MAWEYIDLIVVDIMMPGMDGYELTKSIRESRMDLPILMVTARDQFDDVQKGFRSGTDDYMIKPVNVKELVRVTDHGDGMTEEIQKYIFEKFYQGDSSRRDEGRGLGLALVKRIIDLCRGEITVRSAPGEGALFQVALPN